MCPKSREQKKGCLTSSVSFLVIVKGQVTLEEFLIESEDRCDLETKLRVKITVQVSSVVPSHGYVNRRLLGGDNPLEECR